MNTDELGKLYPITVVPYDGNWTLWFEKEKQYLAALLGPEIALRIEHIGSTAVPQLSAKPTIDILVEIPNGNEIWERIMSKMQENNYIHMKEQKNHLMFVKGYSPTGSERISFHIHMGSRELDFLWDRVYFRDYLRENPAVAKQYEALKHKLAGTHKYDREAYTDNKAEFVRRITGLAKAGDRGSSNLWDAEWDITEKDASELISSQFPELAATTVRKLGYGWDNTVFLVEDKYVFRFPRRKAGIPSLNIEGKVLPHLEEFISIPYSKPLFFGVGGGDYPAPFLGYHYLNGKFPLGLADEQRALSAQALAHFLRGLHSFPLQKAQEFGIQHDHRNLTDISQRKQKMQTFMSDLAMHLNEEEQRTIEVYLNRLTLDRVEPRHVFLHGDLHFKNILVDKQGLVSGIIDWGDMNIGHPACDLSICYSFLPPNARTNFFEQYGGVEEETKILARLIAVFIPMLILMQAVDDGDETAAAEAKATIMRALTD